MKQKKFSKPNFVLLDKREKKTTEKIFFFSKFKQRLLYVLRGVYICVCVIKSERARALFVMLSAVWFLSR